MGVTAGVLQSYFLDAQASQEADMSVSHLSVSHQTSIKSSQAIQVDK